MCLSSFVLFVFVFNDTATTEIYTSDTLFPYTTLFRAPRRAAAEPDPALRGVPAAPAVLDADHARRRRRPGGAHRPRRPRARALGRYRVACRLRADGRRRAGAQRDRRDARWLAGEAFSRRRSRGTTPSRSTTTFPSNCARPSCQSTHLSLPPPGEGGA